MPSRDLSKLLVIPQLLIGLSARVLERSLEAENRDFCIDSGRRVSVGFCVICGVNRSTRCNNCRYLGSTPARFATTQTLTT
jgi:hypothetical protein